MKVRWVGTSLHDLRALRAYVAQFNPLAAQRIAGLVVANANRLAEFPHLGRATDWTNIRIWVVPGSPYLLPYRVTEFEIQILAVVDGRTERAGEWR